MERTQEMKALLEPSAEKPSEDADELKSIDSDLAEEYQETISYLDSLSDEDYQSLKEELLQQVEVN